MPGLREKMSDREKAAYLLGVISATKSLGWPEELAEEEDEWLQTGMHCKHILCGGAFNPLHHIDVMDAADAMLTGPENKI